MASVSSAVKQVKPILSLTREDARRKVISLYRAWSRQIPTIVIEYDMTKNSKQCRQKLREEFMKHKDVTDIRVIDMLVIKGQMDLREIVGNWKTIGAVMNYWHETCEPKPKDFMSKFISGQD